MTIYIIAEQQSSSQTTRTSIPFSREEILATPTKIPESEKELHAIEPEDLEGLQITETSSDGDTIYTSADIRPSRPNILKVRDGVTVFNRTVRPEGFDEKITDYTDTYGAPEEMITGSRFYGPSAQIYIYASSGFAFVANPETQEVFEQYTFPPKSVTEYIKKYGEDILNK